MWHWKTDPETPWWVKLRRVRLHIDEVHQRIRTLDALNPWPIDMEPLRIRPAVSLARFDGPIIRRSGAFRFRIQRPIPADLCAAAGDAIANMRSALEYVAYELAVRHTGTLAPRQEMATAFPIYKDREAFEEFFTVARWRPVRAEIFGEIERLASVRKLIQEINLLLADDPSPYKHALGERLEQLHQSLSGWVLPRIFVTADETRRQ